jgi:hypothetical protein
MAAIRDSGGRRPQDLVFGRDLGQLALQTFISFMQVARLLLEFIELLFQLANVLFFSLAEGALARDSRTTG